MRLFQISIDIAAPPQSVWAVMKDVERWHEWTPTITSVRFVRGERLEPGAKVRIKQPKFPPAMWQVSEVRDGRSFTWVSVAPGLRVTAIHSVEPQGDGSRATLRLEFTGVLGGVWARLTQKINDEYLALEAAGLKRHSEAGPQQ